jgi:Ala-tRNA(Pro) deacylase
MATPLWVWKALGRRGIPYEELRHRPAYTARQVARREHVSAGRVAKVVLVLADGRPVELVLPANRRVNLEKVRAALGAREVRLASEAEVARVFTECEVGAAPALRHWAGVDVLMDRSLTVVGPILLQAGTHEDAVRLNFRDWYEMVRPQVAAFSEPAEPARA